MDEAFTDIVHGIRGVVNQLIAYAELKSQLPIPSDISQALPAFLTPEVIGQLITYAELKSQLPAPSDIPQAQSTPPKVLIMDDDTVMGNYLELLLKNANIGSQHVINGEQGLMAAQKFCPHLIVLDLAMPVVEGFEVIRRLRALPSTRSTSIIVLTGLDSEEYRMKAFELGANDYIKKPFRAEELLARVKVQLSKL
ncbi:hypothetical protein KSF_088680 [Reticulibacter mediterranei]|uniref:Response regulatory domain-containing protein n=2 Tax=Reticulibacter mediterranei TaxID=2778369 RepID=A0A8J3IXY3_9CHLR|nr:hypothetical protein KSF_088680 [Reticulibacter mediterranei]